MSFFMLGVEQRLGKDNKLLKLNNLIDWSKLEKYLRGIHKNDINSQGGPKSYDNIKMFKAILLQQWHSLSETELEEALSLRLDFMVFTGFKLGEDVPDSSTINRFRNTLIKKELDKVLFHEINKQLEQIGLKVEKSKGAVIDATIIESAARPRRTIKIEKDREESGEKIEIEESKDPDAKWLTKGKHHYFGYKGFIVTDDEGYINDVKTMPANEAEIDKLDQFIPNIKAKRLEADKGYASENNRELLRKAKIKNGIMYKAAKNKPLTQRQTLFNKLVSKTRYVVEQSFGILKRIFSFTRASYCTNIKVEAQMRLKATCVNLLKAVNKVKEVHSHA